MGLKKKFYNGGLTCAVGVSNLDKAIEWYKEVLDFELIYKLDQYGWCEMRSPVSKVNVGLSQTEKLTTGGGATLTWGVSDIEVAKEALVKKDVKFDGEINTIPEMVKLLTFFDPDGNTLMLFQDLGEPANI